MKNEIFEIKSGIYLIGSQDSNRKSFDSLFPLPKGTTYNAYLIKGSEKTALVDTVDPKKKDELISQLKELNVHVDYIISNHSEQDHSGSIPSVLGIFPDAKVLTNKIAKEFLKDLLNLEDNNFIIVNESAEISLGDKTLKFIMFPAAHWPETMFTYLKEDKILFTCDMFGSHYSFDPLKEPYFNDKVLDYAKKYYAEIMMPFKNTINFNLKKLKDINIKLICPSHGPIHNKPERIINLYEE